MLKVNFLFFSIWLFVSAIFSCAIWCVFHYMPNDGWLYWMAVVEIVLLFLLYGLFVLSELLCYIVYIRRDKILNYTINYCKSIWSIIAQAISNPFVFIRQFL